MGFFRKSPDLGSTPLRKIPERTKEDVAEEQELGREFTVEELRERHAQKEREAKEKELQERRKKREEEENKKKKKKEARSPHEEHDEHGDDAHRPEALTHHGHDEHGDHGHEEKKEKKPGVGNFDVGKYVLLKKATDFYKAATSGKKSVDHHDIAEYRNIKESVSSLNKDAKRETFDFVNARFGTLIHHPTKDSKEFERDFSFVASKFFPKEMAEVLFDKQKKQIIENIFEKTKDEIKDKKEKEAIKEALTEFSSQKSPDVKKVVEALCRVEFPSFPFRLFRANLTETLDCFYPLKDNPKKKRLDELHTAVDFFSQYREIEQKIFVKKQEQKKTKEIDKQISKTKPLPTKVGGFLYKIVNPEAAPFVHGKTNFPKIDGGKVAYAIEFPEILPTELNLIDLILNILEEYKNQKSFSDTIKQRTKTIQNKIKDGIIRFPISTPSLDRVIEAFLALDFEKIQEEELPLPKVIRELPSEETTVKPVLDIVDEEEESETTLEDVNGSEDTREEEAHPEQTTEDGIRKDDSATTPDNTHEEIKTPVGMQPEPEKNSDVRKKTHVGYLLSRYLQILKRKYPSEELEEYLITLRRVPYKDILNYAKIHLLPEIEGISVSLRVAIAHEDLDEIEKILRPPLSPEAAEAIQELITPPPEKPSLLSDAEIEELLKYAEKESTEAKKKQEPSIEAKHANTGSLASGRAEVETVDEGEDAEFTSRENFPITLKNGVRGEYTGRLKAETQGTEKIFLPDTTNTEETGLFLFSHNGKIYKLQGDFQDGEVTGEVSLFYDIAPGLSVEYKGTVNPHTLVPESNNAVAYIKSITNESQSVRTFYGKFVDGKMDVKNGRFDPPFQQGSGEIFLDRITGETIGREDDLPDVDVNALPPLEATGPLPTHSEGEHAHEDDFSDLSFSGEDQEQTPADRPPLLSDDEEQKLKEKERREEGLEFYNILTSQINGLLPIFDDDERENIENYLAAINTVEPLSLLQYIKDNPLPLTAKTHSNLYKFLRQEIQKANTNELKKHFEEIWEMQEIQEALKHKENEKKDEKIEFLKIEVIDYLSLLLPLYRQNEKENIEKIIDTLKELDEDDSDLFQVYSEVMHDISKDLEATNSKLFVQTIKILEQFGRSKDLGLLRRHFEAIFNNTSVKVALSRNENRVEVPTQIVQPALPIITQEGETTRNRIGKFILYMREVGLETEFVNILENDAFRKRLLSRGGGNISDQILETLRDETSLTKERLVQKGIEQRYIDDIEKTQIIYGLEDDPEFQYYKLLDDLSKKLSYNTGR